MGLDYFQMYEKHPLKTAAIALMAAASFCWLL